MSFVRSLACVSAVLLGVWAGPARAADAPPIAVLRTLTYTVAYSAQTRNDEQTSGFLGGGTGAIAMGNAHVERNASTDDAGTLTVDVLAATADGGLVVDAAYTGKTSAQPKIRVAILRDGRLTFDPRLSLSVEAQHVLPMLARGFVADRDVSPGTSWSVPLAAPAKGETTYRVKRVDGAEATLAIDTTIDVPGVRGFSESETGMLVYHTDRLCPTAVDLTIHERHAPAPDQYATTNARLTASLAHDSFVKPGA